MKAIRRSEVPIYLRTSDFYLSLDEEDDEILHIPEINFKQTKTVADGDSLRKLLSTLLFWGIHEVLDEVYDAVVSHSVSDNVLSDFSEELRYLVVLRKLRNVTSTNKKLTIAFADGNLQVAKYLMQKAYDESLILQLSGGLGQRLTTLAAGGGHLDCLMYAHSLNCAWNHEACDAAASRGQCHCLVYLHENGCKWSGRSVMQAAAIGGHVKCMRYLVAEGCPVSSTTFTTIAISDNVECLEFVYSLGILWDDFGVWAARSDAVKCLAFAFKHGYKFEMDKMLQFRSTECLQLVHDNGFVWTTKCASIVAASGKIELFRYLHQLGCPWDADTCLDCVHNCHNIDCLRYAIEHGCPCDERAFMRASSKCNVMAMEFMHASGCLDGGIPNAVTTHRDMCRWAEKMYNKCKKNGIT